MSGRPGGPAARRFGSQEEAVNRIRSYAKQRGDGPPDGEARLSQPWALFGVAATTSVFFAKPPATLSRRSSTDQTRRQPRLRALRSCCVQCSRCVLQWLYGPHQRHGSRICPATALGVDTDMAASGREQSASTDASFSGDAGPNNRHEEPSLVVLGKFLCWNGRCSSSLKPGAIGSRRVRTRSISASAIGHAKPISWGLASSPVTVVPAPRLARRVYERPGPAPRGRGGGFWPRRGICRRMTAAPGLRRLAAILRTDLSSTVRYAARGATPYRNCSSFWSERQSTHNGAPAFLAVLWAVGSRCPIRCR
jgi:hypothetical protein